MTIETEPAPSTEREKQTGGVPIWLVVAAVLAVGGVAEVISYGYIDRPGWVGVADKKFWNYLELLIVPVVLAIGVAMINWMQGSRERKAEDAQQERELRAAEASRNRALQVEKQRSQDEALQAYLNQMSRLLLDRDLRNSEEDSEVRILARARTLTILARFDGGHERSVLQFLYESHLLIKGREVVDLKGADLSEASLGAINLHGADLSEVNLRGADLNAAGLSDADLSDADLSEANLRAADLSEAYLRGADFLRADLRGADLNEAKLSGADMSGARLSAVNLHGADLRGADLSDRSLSEANLRGADLSDANLRDADLRGADLHGADLSEADLRGADLMQVRGVTNMELAQLIRLLAGVTMPNGQKYEDWLKDKERSGEDGGERGLS
jgi:uncharacterized protein YjbI with pentapeptide repeats